MRYLFVLFLAISFNIHTSHAQADGGDKEKKVKATHLTKADFLAKVMDYEKNPDGWKYIGDKPAIIDFYASWCGPCRILAPTIEALAKEYDGEIYVYKIDTEKEKELAALFQIRSIPSLLFIPMDGIPQMAQGVMPKKELVKVVDEFLLNKK